MAESLSRRGKPDRISARGIDLAWTLIPEVLMTRTWLVLIGFGLFVARAHPASSVAQTSILGGSQGPLADSCGAPPQPGGAQPQAPAAAGARGTPVFPSGQYPVKLPSASLLGARNDLPNP